MNMKRIIKGIGRPLAVLLAVLLLFLTVLFGLAQTDMGKKGTARMITAILCLDGKSCVEIKGLTGLVPFDFQVDRITSTDPEGQWLVLEDISFRWSPLSLFKGIFHVENLDIKLARLSRFAQSREKSESGSNALLARPLSFQWLRVDRFAIERFSMGDAVLGKHAVFRASGKVMSIGDEGAGNLAADGHFSGTLLQPKVTVTIEAMGLELNGFRVSELGGVFNLRFLGEPGPLFTGIHVSGSGHMDDVFFRDARNAQCPFPEPRLKWRFDADVPLKQALHIRQLELAGEKLTMGLSGRMNTAGPGGTVDVLMEIMDTQGLSDFFGFELPGPARLNAKIQGDQYARSLTAHVQGKINLLAPKFRPVASLFGEEIDYSGDLALTEANSLKVSELRLETGAGTFIADASLDLSQECLEGSWRFSAPQLEVFSTALKRNMGGSLHVDGKVKGIPGKMTLTGKAVIQGFLFQGLRFDHVAATANARETASGGAGDLSVELRQANKEARGKTHFVLKGHDLTLSSIFVQAAGSQVHGNMNYFLDRDLAEGVLHADCEDISGPASLFGKEIKGSVHIETRFQIIGTEQQVLFVTGGRGLASKTGQVNTLKLSGRLTNLAEAPQGNVTLDIEGLSFNDLSVASLTLGAEGNTDQFTFSGKAGGKYKSDFEIAASGNVISSQEGQELNLDQLNGQLGNSILGLNRATQIKRTAKGWKFEPFVLDLDQGHVQGSGNCMDGMLDVNIKFEDLPLEALQFAGLPGLDGIAAGSIYFSGPVSHPEGGIILRLNNAGIPDRQYHELPPSVLQAKAALKNDSLHADLTLKGLADRPLELKVEIPVIFSLSPFVWKVPAQEKLKGRLAGGVDLAHVFLFVDLPDQNLDGQVEIGLTLDGTAGDPRIKGYARIKDGVYENVRSGTFLKDAELEIAADSARLIVERGLMSDGQGGNISLLGRVDLVPMHDFPFIVELVFEKVALVRQDYATVTAGGKMSFSGSLAEAVLAGQLEIVSADFQIPKRLPPDVTELEVVEINKAGEERGCTQASARPKRQVIKLNASVLSPGHVFIRGRGLESEWKGNLKFTGSADEPIIAGKLSVVRGFFNFLGKRFNLKEGRINFYGAFPPSPSLDVMAEFSTQDMLARLRLSGSITEPLLELSSEPSLPKDEILSHILFGRSITDITPVQAIQLAQAVDTLARGNLDFLGRVRRFLGVDQLEVKQTENGISENGVSQTGIEASAISVGKYVHEKVYVTTERGMQDESGKVSVEVEVTPNITVETEVRENAEGGMGVKWKWNY